MILKQEKFLNIRKGFTLLELIISISILGVITSVTLPNLSFFKNYQNKLKLEKELIIIEDTFKQEMMNSMDYNITRRYPLMGSSNSQTVGFCNITNSVFYDYSGHLLSKTNLYDFYNNYKTYNCNVGGISSGVFKVDFTVLLKDGKKFVFKYDVIDNKYSYRDYGYLIGLEYYYSEDVYKMISFT